MDEDRRNRGAVSTEWRENFPVSRSVFFDFTERLGPSVAGAATKNRKPMDVLTKLPCAVYDQNIDRRPGKIYEFGLTNCLNQRPKLCDQKFGPENRAETLDWTETR